MDNCGPHGTDVQDVRNQVTLFTLPPNCTAIHQPMDMGVIAAWKRRYRGLLLKAIVRDLESRRQRRDDSRALRAGMRGLGEGHDPHMLDVARLVEQSWNAVDAVGISRCWIKAEVLPVDKVAELNAVHGRMRNTSGDATVREMTDMLRRLSLDADRRDPIYPQVVEMPTEQDVERWINIEADEEILEAVVNDSVEAIGKDSATADGPQDSVTSDSEDEENDEKLPLPARSALLRPLDSLEEIAYRSEVPEAIRFLRKARRAFLDAKRNEDGRATTQCLITEVLDTLQGVERQDRAS